MGTEAGEAIGSRGRPGLVFAAFLRLGLTSFGGPTAHIGYFRTEFVVRRRWLSDAAFSELVVLCQLLPGPASSQLGFAIGLRRAGWLGAVAAFAAFTLPSVAIMLAFAFGLQFAEGPVFVGAVAGLMAVAVAVVAHAVLGMARSLLTGPLSWGIGVAACAAALAWRGSIAQVLVIGAGGLLGWAFWRNRGALGGNPSGQRAGAAAPTPRGQRGVVGSVGARAGAAALVALFILLVGVPLIGGVLGGTGFGGTAALVDAFVRSGALVFGGGHAVLPLLESATVQSGWVQPGEFLAGYSLAQAVPGPMFSFAAYLGAIAGVGPGGVAGGLIAVLAVFTPGFLLLVAVLPFWAALNESQWFRAAVRGASAAILGVLAAALYTPIATGGLTSAWAIAVALVGFVLLLLRTPAWAVVAVGAAAGVGAALLGA